MTKAQASAQGTSGGSSGAVVGKVVQTTGMISPDLCDAHHLEGRCCSHDNVWVIHEDEEQSTVLGRAMMQIDEQAFNPA